MDRKKFISRSLVAATGIIIVPRIIPEHLFCQIQKETENTKTVRIGIAYETLTNEGSGKTELDAWGKRNNPAGPIWIEAVRNSNDNSFIARVSYSDDLTVFIGSCYPFGIENIGIKGAAKGYEPVSIKCSLSLITGIALKLERRLSWDAEKQIFKHDHEANFLLAKGMREG